MRLCHWGTETDVPPPNTYAKRMSAAKLYLLICLFGMPVQVHPEEKSGVTLRNKCFLAIFFSFSDQKILLMKN